jgi:hypothetical protein
MTDERPNPEERPSGSEERARSQALAMLRQAHGKRAELAEVGSRATGAAARELASAISSVAQAEQELEAAATGNSISGSTLALLNGVVQIAANAVQSASAAESRAPGAGELAAVSAEMHRVVQDASRDIFDRKIFDSYLRFGSKEEEEEYRRQEAERKAEIDKLLKENTPESNRRAAALTLQQLDDAGAHGATASPQFAPLRQRVAERAQQYDAIRTQSNARSGSEYRKANDDAAHHDMRTELKRRGVPEAEIARVLASSDPARAMARYMTAADSPGADTAHGAAAEPHRPFEHQAASTGAKPAPQIDGSMLAGIDLASMGVEAAPIPAPRAPRQVTENTPAAPAAAAIVAEVDLSSIGVSTTAAPADKGHGLPEKGQAAEKAGVRTV